MERYVLGCVPRLKRNIRHSALPARRAIDRRGSTAQTRDGRYVLIHGAALLLRGHAGLRLRGCAHLWRHVGALGVLGLRRAGMLLRLLGEGGGLLLILRVGVLVVDGGLLVAGEVGRLGILLHGDWEMLDGILRAGNGRCGC
jgi:hypothetical protein